MADLVPLEPPAQDGPRIRLRENGPLVLEGDVAVAGLPASGQVLCRCGHSLRKPWCDGQHRHQGFRAAGELPRLPDDENLPSPQVLIQPTADGPLVVQGTVNIVNRQGQMICRSRCPRLCRCGHSADKPWCDGSHARVGFSAPA